MQKMQHLCDGIGKCLKLLFYPHLSESIDELMSSFPDSLDEIMDGFPMSVIPIVTEWIQKDLQSRGGAEEFAELWNTHADGKSSMTEAEYESFVLRQV
eukprot:COSAG01_NODE_4999_length_4557_cov_15.544674_4_plen_98_part_00